MHQLVFVEHTEAGRDIFVANADGQDKIRLTYTGDALTPAWSRDGKRIAFATEKTRAIYVMNADGTNQHLVSDRAYFPMAPVWSPDDTKLAFRFSDGIAVVNYDGSGYRELPVTTMYDTQISWSPTGDDIAYSCVTYSDARSRFHEVCVVNAHGSQQRQLTFGMNSPVDPSWSPDGSQIAFSASNQIMVMNADGSGKRTITRRSDISTRFSPSWSADSKYVIYTGVSRTSDAGLSTFSANLDGTDEKLVLSAGFTADLSKGKNY